MVSGGKGRRLTAEALAFAKKQKLITRKAREIAREFETAREQIAVLELAISLRKAGQRLNLIAAARHLLKLNE
jgi:hypothetical protein